MGRRKPKPHDSQLPDAVERRLRRMCLAARAAALAQYQDHLQAIQGLRLDGGMRADLEGRIKFLRYLAARWRR